MKNFKKWIFLGVILGILLIIIIYKNVRSNDFEEFEFENTYVESNDEIIETINEEINYIVLHITGEVKNPGVIQLEENSRLIDAIEKAGGLTENADVDKINLAYMVSDGQKIYVPSIYDKEGKNYITQDSGENVIVNDFTLKSNSKVNINTALQTELETLKGIGPSMALKIIKYRKENGKFNSIEEIKNVPGIGDAKFEAIKDDICI